MRGVLVIVMTGIASATHAHANPGWADWVGSYRGALTWSGCSVAGARSAPVALAFVDGVATLDLAATRPGMPALTLIEDEHGLSGQSGDVTVTLRRPRADAVTLAIELDSGCRVGGTLTRPTSGVPACDRLLGWARIEAACTKQPAPTEELAPLLVTRWRAADAARCTRRADTLEHHLIDLGCAPAPELAGVHAPACLALAQLASRLGRCTALLPALRQQAAAIGASLGAAAQTADRATLPVVEQQCRDASAPLGALAVRFRCP